LEIDSTRRHRISTKLQPLAAEGNQASQAPTLADEDLPRNGDPPADEVAADEDQEDQESTPATPADEEIAAEVVADEAPEAKAPRRVTKRARQASQLHDAHYTRRERQNRLRREGAAALNTQPGLLSTIESLRRKVSALQEDKARLLDALSCRLQNANSLLLQPPSCRAHSQTSAPRKTSPSRSPTRRG
jgi:hypothetical protein